MYSTYYVSSVEGKQCYEQVWSQGLWTQTHQCPDKIEVTREGKGYCKPHDPIKAIRRRKAQSAKWDAEAKKREAKRDREAEKEESNGQRTLR